MKIAIKKDLADHVLTQKKFVAPQAATLSLDAEHAARQFTRTYMSSFTAQHFFEVGGGHLDSASHVRMILQSARTTGTSVSELVQQYMNELVSFGYSQEKFQNIVSALIGTSNRPVPTNRQPVVTPTFVMSLVESELSPDAPEFFKFLITDFVCHLVRPFGWIMSDAPYLARVAAGPLFPTYDDLVDLVTAVEVRTVVDSLANADLSLVKKALDARTAILPAQVAAHMASAVVTAYEQASGFYSAPSVVGSVLTSLVKSWDPVQMAKDGFAVSPRVARSAQYNELLSNLAIFKAAQHMLIAHPQQASVVYSDEEMVSEVLPLFTRALDATGVYKLRMISDVAEYIGKKSVTDHEGNPLAVFLYESWKMSTAVEAFIPVRQTTRGSQQFLIPQNHAATALESALKPIQSTVSMETLVQSRVDSLTLTEHNHVVMANDPDLWLGFPSLVARGQASAVLSEYQDPRIVYDYRALIYHLAVTKSAAVETTAVVDDINRRIPVLVFSTPTHLKKPIGNTAILHGQVKTYEPLEAILYSTDYSASASLELQEVDLAEFKHAVHVWDWKSQSRRFSMTASYATRVHNQRYVITVDEHQMLALGVKLQNVHVIIPSSARAITALWTSWNEADDAFIKAAIRSTKDTLVRKALEGRQIQNAISMLNFLIRVGSVGTGGRIANLASQKLAEQMYSAGEIDYYSETTVGVHKQRLNVWAGLTVLQVLDLLDEDQTRKIVRQIEDTNALSFVISETAFAG